MIGWTGILIASAMALVIYRYLIRPVRHFEKLGIPHVKPIPLLGNMGPVVFKRRAVAEQMKWIYDRKPDVKYIGFHLFTSPTIMLRDPEIIKYMTVAKFDHFVNHGLIVDHNSDPFYGKNLFTMQGHDWREMRYILSPSFTSKKLKDMFQVANSCCRKFVEDLGSGQKFINIKDQFSRYSMDVIAKAALGLTVETENPDDEFFVAGRESTELDYVKSLKIFSFKLSPWLMKILKIAIIADRDAKFFTDVVQSTISMRQALRESRNDMIQLMMEAKSSGKAPNLSIEKMAAQAFLFVFAGFESTSTTMSFGAYELAIKPQIQDKLQAEIDAVKVTLEGKDLTWEVFQGMNYLEAVANETLRMYSPAFVTDRVCNKTIEIPPAIPGDPPFLVQPGTTFWIPLYAIHRDERYFKNPELFDPQRFIDPTTGKYRQPYGYMPFGMGPRFCLGERFAVMEVKLAFFYLLAHYRLEPCSKTRIPMTFSKDHFSLRAEHDYWVQISPRH